MQAPQNIVLLVYMHQECADFFIEMLISPQDSKKDYSLCFSFYLISEAVLFGHRRPTSHLSSSNEI
jgi:hypothetical protein